MRTFRHFLELAMRARWVTVLIAVALFGASLYGMRLVPQQFFPPSDRPELMVDLQLPENASIYATREAAARLDKLLKGDQDVDHWSTYVGRVPYVSICLSTFSCPMTFSARRWSSPRA